MGKFEAKRQIWDQNGQIFGTKMGQFGTKMGKFGTKWAKILKLKKEVAAL